MGWNRLSFLFFKLKWTKEIEKIVPKWNRLSFLCLEWAKKWECRKNKIEKYIISKSLDKQKIKPHNKETIKTNTKCLRRQFTHHTGTTWAKVGWSSWQDKSSSQKGWVSIDCSVVAALLSTTTRPVHKSSTGCWRVVTGCWQGVTGWYWRAVTGCWQGVTGWYWRAVTGRYKGVTGCYRGVTGCWRGVTEYWRGVTGRFFVLGLLLFFLFHNSYKKLKGNHGFWGLGHMCPNPPQPPLPLMMGGWDTCVPTQWWPTCYGL